MRIRRNTRLAEARKKLDEIIDPVERSQKVSLDNAEGRILSSPVIAEDDFPRENLAATDGWAVVAEDTHEASDSTPCVLEILGSDEDVDEYSEKSGTVSRINSGDGIPEGYDSVLDSRNAKDIGGKLEVYESLSEGENVAIRGEDIQEDEEVAENGQKVRTRDLGVIRSAGKKEVEVYEEPVVEVVLNKDGNEDGVNLEEESDSSRDFSDTNSLLLSSLVETWGGDIGDVKVVSEASELRETFLNQCRESDLVVSVGGTGQGDDDFTPESLDEVGDLEVYGVGVEPGRTAGFGKVNETPVVMLPGSPVSCFLMAHTFVRLALLGMNRLLPPTDMVIDAELDRKVRSEVGMRSLVRVRIEKKRDRTVAVPLSRDDRKVSEISKTDAVVEISEEREGYASGETVEARYIASR